MPCLIQFISFLN